MWALGTGLIALAISYVSSLPFELARVVSSSGEYLRQAIVETALFTLIYTTSFTVVGWYLWRSSKSVNSRVLIT
jgi:hypothetical protein